jgi:beta-xylosidase
MGRETVLTAVSWPKNEFSHFTPITGKINTWPFPKPHGGDIQGYIETIGDDISFAPNKPPPPPPHLTYWRYPHPESYTISPPGHPNTLRLTPSSLNLTALDGNYADLTGQTFVGRRQQDTLFTYSINLSFSPISANNEAGVSVFLTQNHHLDLGIVLLSSSSATAAFPGRNFTTNGTEELISMVRCRGTSYISIAEDVIVPLPEEWRGQELRLEIKAGNMTHYDFSAGPAGRMSETRTIMTVNDAAVSWGFTGTILGVYCTTNGGDVRNGTEAYVGEWRYVPQGQFRD